ncbi:uncharacterized protein LOC127749469 [Frankliniella occidentalis]|uniref:Uncharacterized protein LOC127749469 n=1 Tax=Frankliniella occidentalis TaxID=133901 RepID=A0A9C6U623_FRAOC|nr:uncharacterized protein LOC127749469 [Frankliniella occidentalis]
MSSFVRNFENSVDNKMRKYCREKSSRKVVKGRGTVGVLIDKYQPTVRNTQEQEGIKESMKNEHGADPTVWDWDAIHKQLTESFPLQRQEIVDAKDGLLEPQQADAEEADEPPEKMMEKLKKSWPFLFTMNGIEVHYKILSGRDLSREVTAHITNKLDIVIMYLTTLSHANIQNLALKMRVEQIGQFHDTNVNFCCAL